MKKIFFDIDNGEVVKPRNITAPAYLAVIEDESLKITELYSCFSKFKLEAYGYKWENAMLHQDCFEWVNYSWLMKSLRKYILLIAKRSDKDDYEDEYREHYRYLRFWKRH
jgi:hypothetical protein